MSLIKSIVAEFEKALTRVFTLEADKTRNYMNQTILGCRWRAFWGIVEAIRLSIKPMVKILALAIAKHRVIEHGDDKSRTISSLTRSMTDEQIKASEEDSGFWSLG